MVLSKRERYIAVATFSVVAILMMARLVLTPIQERKAAMEEETQQVLVDLRRTRVLFDRRKDLAPKWQTMLDAGLKFGPAEAESQVLHAIRNWSREAGMSLSSLRPERVKEKGKLREMTFMASGTGRMSAVAGFIWRLENSAIPVRITEFQLGSRKEGTDDLSLQLRISALCQPADPQMSDQEPTNQTVKEDQKP